MLAFVVRRIAVSIPILLISSFIVFLLASLSGNPLSGLLTRNPPPRRRRSPSKRTACGSTCR